MDFQQTPQAYEIIDNFFSSEEDDELVQAGQTAGAQPPAVPGEGGQTAQPPPQQFAFQPTQQNVPDEGFSFQWSGERRDDRSEEDGRTSMEN